MPTTVTLASDSIYPVGPLIPPSAVTVTYAGPPGFAVWRDIGRPIITTADEMRLHTSTLSSFGRESLKHLGSAPRSTSAPMARGTVPTSTTTAGMLTPSCFASQTSATSTGPALIYGSTARTFISTHSLTHPLTCSRSARMPTTLTFIGTAG
jgi:hypothetical protein